MHGEEDAGFGAWPTKGVFTGFWAELLCPPIWLVSSDVEQDKIIGSIK